MAGWIIRHGQAAWRVNTPRDKVISDKVHWSCLMGVGAAATPCWTSTTSFCCRRSQKKWSKYWRHAAYISLAAVLVHTAGGWGWGVFTVLLIDHLLCSFTISFSFSLSHGLMISGRPSTDAANEPASPSSSWRSYNPTHTLASYSQQPASESAV